MSAASEEYSSGDERQYMLQSSSSSSTPQPTTSPQPQEETDIWASSNVMNAVSDEDSKVPLHFPSIIPGTAHEGILDQLKHALEDKVYTWDPQKFHIPFPPTLPRQAAAIQLSDLIRDPDFRSEIYELAFDRAANKLRKLDFMQLQEIRRTGEFSIPSKCFPGQFHVWRLTALLQKGKNNIAKTSRKEIAGALKNIIEWIPNRLYRSSFSIPSGIKSIARGLYWDLPSLLWGWIERDPEFNEYTLETIINRKMKKFIMEELKYVKEYSKDDFSFEANQVVSVDGQVYDFRLFNTNLHQKVVTRLIAIQAEVDKEFNKKALLLQKQLSAELHKAGATSNLAKEVAGMLEAEKSKMIVAKIQADSFFNSGGQHLVKPVLELLEEDQITRQAVAEYNTLQEDLRRKTLSTLQKEHSIKFLIDSWTQRQVDAVLSKFSEDNKFYILTRCIELAEERKLELAVYLFKRTLFFTREREPALRAALSARRVPSKTYTFHKTVSHKHNFALPSRNLTAQDMEP